MKARDLFEDVPYGGDGDEGPAEPAGQGQGVTMVQIMNAIPRPARRRIIRLLKAHFPDYAGKINQLLRAELRPLERELAAVGLLPDYAAYMIPYFVYTHVKDASDIDGLDEPDPAAN